MISTTPSLGLSIKPADRARLSLAITYTHGPTHNFIKHCDAGQMPQAQSHTHTHTDFRVENMNCASAWTH